MMKVKGAFLHTAAWNTHCLVFNQIPLFTLSDATTRDGPSRISCNPPDARYSQINGSTHQRITKYFCRRCARQISTLEKESDR